MKNIIKDPIYQQLNNILRDRINKGEFKSGDKFLTERKICEKYNVSRVTANKALSNLVSEGILEFKKGVGTFVAEKIIDFDICSLISFTNSINEKGKKPVTKVLQFKKIISGKVDINLAHDLKISENDNLYFVERLRTVNKVPYILEQRYIVEKYCPNMNKNLLQNSLYNLWTDFYKLKIIGVNQIIKSVLINTKNYKEFDLKNEESGFLVSAIGYIEGGVPLWIEKTLFLGSKYEFRNSIGYLETNKFRKKLI